jgi:hypothetical protein
MLAPFHENKLDGIARLWTLCDSWLEFVEQGILPGGYFFSGAFFQCARQNGPIPREIKRVLRVWLDTLEEALNQARHRDEVRMDIDARQAAFALNGILIGAQWSLLMSHKDHTSAREVIVAKLGGMATDEIPANAFMSVSDWTVYLREARSIRGLGLAKQGI